MFIPEVRVAPKPKESLFTRIALYPLVTGVSFGVGHFVVYWILRHSIFDQFRQWLYSLFE